jgi:hypothetical protein
VTLGDDVERLVKTIDDTVVIFHARGLTSAHVCQLSKGAELALGQTSELEGRLWVHALLPDGVSGYVLGPSALGHTTAGSAIAAGSAFHSGGSEAEADKNAVEANFTGLSILTTLVVWTGMIACYRQAEGWTGLYLLFTAGILVAVGLVVQTFLGSAASDRGERFGWPAALMGMALWILTTILVFFLSWQIHVPRI